MRRLLPLPVGTPASQRLDLDVSCPVPLRSGTVQLAHGGGGRLSRDLVERVLLGELDGPALSARHDSAALAVGENTLGFTTDTYVVKPIFFPGGDIGKLAVYGTVNDLAMAGARAMYLSLGLILEEGFPLDDLARITRSIRAAAQECGVEIATGDTKVVDRGHGDGIFVNTSGIGLIARGLSIRPSSIRPGDAVLVSGDVGRHGIAILSVRDGLAFDAPIESDCASVAPMVAALLGAGLRIHCLRDPTRGGLASVLNEIAADGGVGIAVEEAAIPISEPVEHACEILGLDPLYVPSEGRLVAFVHGEDAECALATMRALPAGRDASRIGRVLDGPRGTVTLETRFGSRRLLDLLSGEQLPRIC